MRDAIELGLKIIATCIALFGVGKYFYDLSLDRSLSAKSAALQRINALSIGKVDEARRNLFDFWLSQAQAVSFFREQEVSENSYSNFIVPAFTVANNSNDLFEAVYVLSQHYDDVFFCVDNSLCDTGMIEHYYCPKVSVTEEVYGPIVQELKTRSGYSNFGAGLEGLNKLCLSKAARE